MIDLLADAGRIDDAESALLASRKNQLEKKQVFRLIETKLTMNRFSKTGKMRLMSGA